MIVRCEVVRENLAAEASDEALVALIQQGVQSESGAEMFGQAYAALLKRMLPVIRARTGALYDNHCAGKAMTAEDLMQEGMLGFLRAVSAFRPERGASFRTFAAVCVSNRVVSALRRGQAGGREFPQEAALLESDSSAAAAMDPQDVFSAMERARRIMEAIQNDLTALERGVMEGYLAGERYDAIARRLDVSSKAVDNALQRVRKKLREFL